MIVGAYGANGQQFRGAAYLVFGSAAPVSLTLGALIGTNGFRVGQPVSGGGSPTVSDFLGYSVSAAGDVNGDTFADLLVGAPEAGPNGALSGQAYLIYGGPSGELVAPTIITGGKSATFTDVDGDRVTVKVNKGTLTGSNFQLLKSSAMAVGAQLLSLNLGPAFDGADVTITAQRAGGGDGKVNVGVLNAGDVDLGKVTVGGDLGGIFADDATADGAITSLTVGSIGFFSGRTSDGGGEPSSYVTGAWARSRWRGILQRTSELCVSPGPWAAGMPGVC